MCEPVTTALILTAVGTGVKAYNQQRTLKKQDQALAEGIRKQGEKQREATRRINETLNFFQQSSPDEDRISLGSAYRGQAQRKMAQALNNLLPAGDVSDAAKQAAGVASGKVGDYATFLADVFSRIDAPTEQRRKEGYERSDLADFLKIIGRESHGEDYLARLRAAGIRPNPWLDILGAGLTGAGRGFASGGFSGGSSLPAVSGPGLGSYGQAGSLFSLGA